MREGRARAVRSRSFITSFTALLAGVIATAGGCATEQESFPDDATAQPGDGGAAWTEGGTPPMAGNAPVAGKASAGAAGTKGGSGGSAVNAFGGTSSTGGKGGASSAGTAGNEAGGAGGSPAGGASAGGKGGSGGRPSSGQGGGGNAGSASGGSGSAGSASGGSGSSGSAHGGSGGGGSLGCLSDWKGGACDTCSSQTQSDKLACVKILECYSANSCGPASCANNDDKCGANKIGQGTAGYPIAKQVYDCSCP